MCLLGTDLEQQRRMKIAPLPLQVHIDDDKALPFLEESSRVFEAILDAEDAYNGPAIEKIMEQLQAAETTPVVQHLVQELFYSEKHGR